MTIYSDESEIEVTEIKIFLDKLSSAADEGLHDKIGKREISEEQLMALTGHTWEAIDLIKNMLQNMRLSSNRSVEQALIIFLFKLKTGNSYNLIAAILDITEAIVRYSIYSILKCFREQVLINNFGVQAHSREFFLQKTSVTASLLYDLSNTGTLFVICDGTYLRHEKSASNIYQRKPFSIQKKVPLCKPFTI